MSASSIVFLSKKKDKDGTEVVGNIVHCKNHKSRLTIENKMVDVRLSYDKGLDRYYGLLELTIKYGIFKQVSTRIELPDGKTQFGKTIINNPEEYFTEEVMKQLNESMLRRNLNMENYIRRYDNVISSELCDTLIDRFENNPHQYEKQEQGEMSFTQIHLLHHLMKK